MFYDESRRRWVDPTDDTTMYYDASLRRWVDPTDDTTVSTATTLLPAHFTAAAVSSTTHVAKAEADTALAATLATITTSSVSATACPDSFCCPITADVMVDPVIDPEGISFERLAILRWLQKSETSPATRTPLRADQLVPNRALQAAIAAVRPAARDLAAETAAQEATADASTAGQAATADGTAAVVATTLRVNAMEARPIRVRPMVNPALLAAGRVVVADWNGPGEWNAEWVIPTVMRRPSASTCEQAMHQAALRVAEHRVRRWAERSEQQEQAAQRRLKYRRMHPLQAARARLSLAMTTHSRLGVQCQWLAEDIDFLQLVAAHLWIPGPLLSDKHCYSRASMYDVRSMYDLGVKTHRA